MTASDGGGLGLGVVVVAALALAILSATTVSRPIDQSAAAASGTEPARPATSSTTTRAATTTPPIATTPTTSTTSTTTGPTTVPEPVRRQLVIQGVGDVNFDPGYIPNLAANGYGFAFEALDGIFEIDDLTVINLECAPSNLGQPVPKTFNFRCDPEALPVAEANGVEVANMANNHVLDYGVEAMLDGRVNVEEAGLGAVGVGADLAEAMAPALFDVGGWTVAVVGMGGVVPAGWWLATEDGPGMSSGDDIEQMVASVEAADALADLVVVSIHWGRELVTEPDAQDRERAEAMIAAGADVIFGHHSHRLGQLELVDGRPVFWTLGNFIWPRLSDAGATTAVARVVIEPDGEVDACLVPVFIATSGQPDVTGPAPCGPRSPRS